MGSGLLSREEARGSPARSRLETFEDETRGWEAPTTAGPCTSNRPRGRPCSTVGQWPVRATRAVAGSTDTASGVAERLLPNGPQRGTKWHTGTSVCHFQTGRHVLIEQIATSPTRKNPEQGPFQSSPTLVCTQAGGDRRVRRDGLAWNTGPQPPSGEPKPVSCALRALAVPTCCPLAGPLEMAPPSPQKSRRASRRVHADVSGSLADACTPTTGRHMCLAQPLH